MVEKIVQPEALVIDSESSSQDPKVGYDERMTRKLVRKIDLHFMPVLVILYLLSCKFAIACQISKTGLKERYTQNNQSSPKRIPMSTH